MKDEASEFHERAAKAIYLEVTLLALLGINPDTARPGTEITERVRLLMAVANAKTCPHVVAGAEGTSYCNLAESNVLALRKQVGEERRVKDFYKTALEKIAGMDYRGNRSTEMGIAFDALSKATEDAT